MMEKICTDEKSTGVVGHAIHFCTSSEGLSGHLEDVASLGITTYTAVD
jgi:hypothetical protein